MKRLAFIAVGGCTILVCSLHAGISVDGSLADWGVTPFSDWVPNPGIFFEVTNNINKYNANYYSEYYDFEALYLASDQTHYYIGLVSSYPFRPLHWNGQQFEGGDGGDIFLDLFGTDMMTISPHGVVSGLDYAIRIASAVEIPGQVVSGPWRSTNYYSWPSEGWQGSPWVAEYPGYPGQTTLGWATVAISVNDYGYVGGQWEDDTYIVELSIARSILPGEIRGVHVTQWCGNDSINLIIPAPGAVLLAALGAISAGYLKSRRLSRLKH